MPETFQAIPISERVYWVGAIDWQLRHFHGYLTSRGTTYSAYLVLGEEPVLIDTVKAPFFDEMMARIRSVIDPATIRWVVSNHSELDHSGALPALLAQVPEAQLIASAQGQRALKAHFHWDRSIRVSANGERIQMGEAAFRFYESKMLHWPDSQLAYLEGDGILFSNDAFGMHIASSQRFADELEPWLLRYEAGKYFANILLPYSQKVTKLIESLPSLDLDLSIIAPDHGPVWRKDPSQIIDLYAHWALQKPTSKTVVVFDSMWQSTALLARCVAEGLTAGGVEVKLMPLDGSHRSDVAAELLEAGALVVGSPTMNNQIYPSVAELMTYLEGLAPANMIGASFGSHGWSPRAVKLLDEQLGRMGVELVQSGLSVQYVADGEASQRGRALGSSIAKALAERLSR